MKLNVKIILFFLCIIGRSLIDAQNAHQESVTIRVSDGQLTIGPATFNLLKMVSQTVREQADPLSINTLSLLELDINDLRMILELMKISNRPTTLEEKFTQYTDLLELAKLYKQLRFLDIVPLMKATERRIAQLVATEKDTKKLKDFLSYLSTQNTDRSLIDLIKKKITDSITVVLKDNKTYQIDRFTVDQLAAESSVIKDKLKKVQNNQLAFPELTLEQLNQAVTLFTLYQSPKIMNAYLAQQSFENLLTALIPVSFLKLDPLKSVLEQYLAKKIIATKSNERIKLFAEIERAVGKRESYQNIEMITDNLKPGMYNFVLKNGLVTKPLSEKNTVNSLIEASQTLKDFATDLADATGQKDTTVFHLQPISKKTFENLYALIQHLTNKKTLTSLLADTKSYGLLPVALLLKAADFLAIATLEDATLSELAKRLLQSNSLKLFKEGRNWETFLGLGEDLDMMLAQKIIHKLKIDLFHLVHTLSEHTGNVSSVTWSPDSKYLASGSWDSTVKIWNASNGQLLNTLKEDNNSVESVTWSPDGKYLATGLDNDTTEIWDTAKWKRLKTLKGHTDSVDSVAWSPDSKYLAIGLSDATAKIWDASTGNPKRTLTGHTLPINAVAWSPDGKSLATGSWDNTAKIWNPLNGQSLQTLSGYARPVTTVAWSPDGKSLVTGSRDKAAKIWNPLTGQLLHTLLGHARTINSVAWSPDSTYLATASADKTAKIWNPLTGQLLHTLLGHARTINSVAWSPDSTYLATASADKTAKIWGILRESDLKNLTLNQAMLIALAKYELENNRPLKLSGEFKKIYLTLSPGLRVVLQNIYKVTGG